MSAPLSTPAVRPWSSGDPGRYWLLCQKSGDGPWHLCVLDRLEDHEAQVVAAGYNLAGQVLDPSVLTSPERDELGQLLNRPATERDALGLAPRERELLARVPRWTAPGYDIDHGITRYLCRGPSGEELGEIVVSVEEAQRLALEQAGRIQAEEAMHRVTLRAAWSGGPGRAGVHLDRGPVEPKAALPQLLWLLYAWAKAICTRLGLPWKDNGGDSHISSELRVLNRGLQAEGWPLRHRLEGKVAGGRSREAVFRDSREKLLVVEVTEVLTGERALELLKRVRRAVPPVWVDLTRLNHRPASRGGQFRVLGGRHKSWNETTAPEAIKKLVDPAGESHATPITAALLEPFLPVVEARLERERDGAATKIRSIGGPAGPEAIDAVKRNREVVKERTAARRWLFVDELSDEMRAPLVGWATNWGENYVGCGGRHEASLGISGVLARQGVAAELAGDLIYLSAIAGGLDEGEAARRGKEAERGARGVLEGGRPAGGLGIVRDALGDDAAEDLERLATHLAMAELRGALHELPGRCAIDRNAIFSPTAIDAVVWGEENDPEAVVRLKNLLKGKVDWRDVQRLVKDKQSQHARERGRTDRRVSVPPYFVDKEGNLNRVQEKGNERLANFYAVIREEVALDDGVETRREMRLEVRVRGGEPVMVRIPSGQFMGLSWLAERVGAAAVLEPGPRVKELVRHAIQVLSGEPPVRPAYGHLGWRQIGDRWIYLHAGGGIGAEGAVPVEVIAQGTLVRYLLPDPPEGEELRTAVRASMGLLRVAPLRVTVPLFLSVYRATLGPMRASPFLVGTTGVFKSCLAALAQQHWGADLHYQALPGSWEGTGNSLEGLAFLCKDALFTVDDFLLRGPKVEQDKMHALADRLFRGAANGSGRSRMRDDLTHRPDRPPRGTVMSSGEQLPRGASCQARLVVIQVRQGDVDPERLTACQRDAATGTYTEALAGFVRWLAARYDEARSNLTRDFAALRDRFQRSDVHRRSPDAAADLALGARYFCDFAVEVGALTTDEADRFFEEWLGVLAGLVQDQAQVQRESDPVDRFFELLTMGLASGAAHLVGPNGRVPLDHPTAVGWRIESEGSEQVRDACAPAYPECWRSHGTRIGWLDGDDLYLLPDVAVRVAIDVSRGDWHTSQTAFTVMLRDRGLLKTVDEGRGTLKIRLPFRFSGSSRQAVWHLGAATLVAAEPTLGRIDRAAQLAGSSGSMPDRSGWSALQRKGGGRS